jgi:prepilin-type N-terminal cleavage/methylation domain-containing protein
MSIKRAGFTLIELLVVIAIIAILAVVVILTLNPAQLLAQARDSNRVSDMATLKTAISLFEVDSPGMALGTIGTCYVTLPSGVFWTPDQTGAWGATTTCGAWFASAGLITATSATSTAIDGSGWIPINFSGISSGAPFGVEPIDPINTQGTGAAQSTGAYFYGFIPAGAAKTFKLSAIMESVKYQNGGAGDVESTDGGNNNYIFEGGTDVGL